MSAMPTDARVVIVVNAIRQSLQVNASAGSSINAHPNPFMLQVLGEVDLLKAAETVLKQLDQYDAHTEETARKAAAQPSGD